MDFKLIRNYFKRYNALDLAKSLFISDIWLSNISSQIKHSLAYALYLSIELSDFDTNNKIDTYKKFEVFCKKLYKFLPSFPSLEDYIPELDWGDIKFPYNGKNYQIFYGGPIANIHDFLSYFRVLIKPIDIEEIQNDFINTLLLQETMINAIKTNEIPDNVELGHIEIPKKEFWEDSIQFLDIMLENKFNRLFLNSFSTKNGDTKNKITNTDELINLIVEGKLFKSYFIKIENKFIPYLPRNYNAILLNKWHRTFLADTLSNQGKEEKSKIFKKSIVEYSHTKFKNTELVPFVSAIKNSHSPHESLIFDFAITDKDDLFLFYILNPFDKDYQKQLDNISILLKKSINIFENGSNSLYLNDFNIVARYGTITEEYYGKLKPIAIIVLPMTPPELINLKIPKNIEIEIIPLDELLGIIDEIDSKEEFANFLRFKKENKKKLFSLNSNLDIFASFRESKGVLNEGAIHFHSVFLEPHWGSNYRYQRLKKFWDNFPNDMVEGDPYTWSISEYLDDAIRVESKNSHDFFYYLKINKSNIYVFPDLIENNFENFKITNLMMECWIGTLSNIKDKIINLDIFLGKQINFFVISKENIKIKKELIELRKFIDDDLWSIVYGIINKDAIKCAIIFDQEKISDSFLQTKNRSLEIKLVSDILKKINENINIDNLSLLLNELKELIKEKPRYTLYAIKKEVSFPDFVDPMLPEDKHFKLARKIIAEKANANSITPGKYNFEEAKKILNKLKEELVSVIDKEVNLYNAVKSITFLISRADAMQNDFMIKRRRVEKGLESQIEYNPYLELGKFNKEYLRNNKHCRYLIEKFTQIMPVSERSLEKEDFQYLMGITNWLFVIQNASDTLHYGISPPDGIEIMNNYTVEVKYSKHSEIQQEKYLEEDAYEKLNLSSKVEGIFDSEHTKFLIQSLDKPFQSSFGFKINSAFTLLLILMRWEQNQEKEQPFYKATIEEIKKKAKIEDKKYNENEIEKILDFFTLDSRGILYTLSNENEKSFMIKNNDIPIWKHLKRDNRYSIKPLIKIGSIYYWGVYSIYTTFNIWYRNFKEGTTPYDFEIHNLQGKDISAILEILDVEKKRISSEIVNTGYKILSNFSNNIEKELDLCERFPKENFPQKLGDYDLLCFFKNKNCILNIECKENKQPYTIKDSRRLREKIFGKSDSDNKYHLKKLLKREEFLKKNYERIFNCLKWELNKNSKPNIISIYLTRYYNWWTKFPPPHINVNFVTLNNLEEFISQINKV